MQQGTPDRLGQGPGAGAVHSWEPDYLLLPVKKQEGRVMWVHSDSKRGGMSLRTSSPLEPGPQHSLYTCPTSQKCVHPLPTCFFLDLIPHGLTFKNLYGALTHQSRVILWYQLCSHQYFNPLSSFPMFIPEVFKSKAQD